MAPVKNVKNSGKKAKAPKAKAKKASKVVVEKVDVPPPVEVDAPPPVEVSDVVVNETSEASYMDEFSELVKMSDEFLKMARTFKARLSKLEKVVSKDRKVLEKKSRGKKRRAPNPDAPPSGFAKPGPVSDELRKFLEIGKEELIARTEVTKAINNYCKEHELQDSGDKRKILPDGPLRKLLKIKKGEELTFFNLQTYLKIHFPNKDGVYPSA